MLYRLFEMQHMLDTKSEQRQVIVPQTLFTIYVEKNYRHLVIELKRNSYDLQR